MLDKIRNFIEENKLLSIGDGVVLGLSGGADSVCLLNVLLNLRDEYTLTLWAVHVNHNIRGEEALRDQRFAYDLCKSRGVELFTYSYDIPRLAKKEGLTEEEAGRKYRYKAFYETAEKVGAAKIALAHNKNDNAETMLQRLLRGTGLKGLGGILPKRDKIIRPLLCLTRTEIEELLGETPYITDSTNSSLDYLRNKIRHKLLPAIEADLNPNIVEGLFRTANLIRKENDYLEEEAQRAYERVLKEKTETAVFLDCKKLSAENEVLQNRIFRLASLPLTQKGQDIELKHIESLKALAKAQNGKQINLIEGIKAKKEAETLAIGIFNDEKIEYSYELFPEKELFIKEASLTILLTAEKRPQKELGRLDPKGLTFPLIVRTKKDGDRLKIKSGAQQIKKIYSQYKIPSSERYLYPILATETEVLAVLALKYGEGVFAPDAPLYLYLKKSTTS